MTSYDKMPFKLCVRCKSVKNQIKLYHSASTYFWLNGCERDRTMVGNGNVGNLELAIKLHMTFSALKDRYRFFIPFGADFCLVIQSRQQVFGFLKKYANMIECSSWVLKNCTFEAKIDRERVSVIHVHQISPTTLKIHYFRMVDGHCTDFDNFDPNSFSSNKTIFSNQIWGMAASGGTDFPMKRASETFPLAFSLGVPQLHFSTTNSTFSPYCLSFSFSLFLWFVCLVCSCSWCSVVNVDSA